MTKLGKVAVEFSICNTEEELYQPRSRERETERQVNLKQYIYSGKVKTESESETDGESETNRCCDRVRGSARRREPCN